MESWWDCAVCALPNDPQYQTCVNCGNVNKSARGTRERFSVAINTPVRSRLSLSPVVQRSEGRLAEEYRRSTRTSENRRGSSVGFSVPQEDEDDLPLLAASITRVLGGLRTGAAAAAAAAAAPSAAYGHALHSSPPMAVAPVNPYGAPRQTASPLSRVQQQDEVRNRNANARLEALQHNYLGAQSGGGTPPRRNDGSVLIEACHGGPTSPEPVVSSSTSSPLIANGNPLLRPSSPSVAHVVRRLQGELHDKCQEHLSLRLELEGKTVEFERELQLTKAEVRSARQESDLQRREMLVLHDEILRLTKRVAEVEAENLVMRHPAVWKQERLLIDDTRQRVHTALDAREDAMRTLGVALRLASSAVGEGLVQQRMKVSIESASLAHSRKVSELQDRVAELERLLEQRTVGGESDSNERR